MLPDHDLTLVYVPHPVDVNRALRAMLWLDACPETLRKVARSGKWPDLAVTRLPQSAPYVPL